MKKIVLLSVILICNFPTVAQILTHQWSNQFGGLTVDEAMAVVVDSNRNVFTVGYFSDTVDFDPGFGINSIVATGFWDMYVTKQNPTGDLVWVKTFGGPASTIYPSDIHLDDDGNIYLSGRFDFTVDFDPGLSVQNLTSFGMEDIFVCKLNSNGSLMWARQMGGTQSDGNDGVKLELDSAGNVYSTGPFQNTGDFDPGPGSFLLTSTTANSAFVSKLDNNGTFLGAYKLGSASSGGVITNDIALDVNGNILLTGIYWGTCDFDPGTGVFNMTALSGAANRDVFICKLDPSGNFVWAKSVGGNNLDNSSCLTTDVYGNVYVGGNFKGTIDLDPGPGSVLTTSFGEFDAFVLRLNAAGNIIWYKKWGNSLDETVNDITFDAFGNLLVTGEFFSPTVDFNPGSGTFNLSVAGVNDIYVLKLNSVGNFYWAIKIGGAADDVPRCMATDQSRGIYLAGSFFGTSDFDPGNGNQLLTSNGIIDGFVVRLDALCTNSFNTIAPFYCGSYTSPSGNYVWSNSGTYVDTIANAAGCDSIITVNLTINPNPVPSISGNVILCQGQNTVLNAGPGYSAYNWSIGSTTQTINITNGGTYWVTVTDANGCTGSDSVLVTVNPLPVPTITGGTSFCQGSSLMLDGGMGYATYLWSNGTMTQTIVVNAGGVYTVTVWDVNGCSGSTSVSVTMNPAPIVNITAIGSTTFCQGDSVRLEAQGSGQTFLWHRNFGMVNPPNATMVHYAKTRGKYYCLMSDSNGCLDTSNFIMVDVPCVPIGPSQQRDVLDIYSTESVVSVSIFPNPSPDGIFQVEINEGVIDYTRWHITDITGRLVPSSFIIISPTQIKMHIESKGVFLLSIPTDTGPVIKKLVSQ